MPESECLMISLLCLISVIAGRQGQTQQEQAVEHQQQGLRPQRRQHGQGQHRQLRVTQLRLQPGVSQQWGQSKNQAVTCRHDSTTLCISIIMRAAATVSWDDCILIIIFEVSWDEPGIRNICFNDFRVSYDGAFT